MSITYSANGPFSFPEKDHKEYTNLKGRKNDLLNYLFSMLLCLTPIKDFNLYNNVHTLTCFYKLHE